MLKAQSLQWIDAIELVKNLRRGDSPGAADSTSREVEPRSGPSLSTTVAAHSVRHHKPFLYNGLRQNSKSLLRATLCCKRRNCLQRSDAANADILGKIRLIRP